MPIVLPNFLPIVSVRIAPHLPRIRASIPQLDFGSDCND
jgi:hypothetical protein